jgi:hypothetical protein
VLPPLGFPIAEMSISFSNTKGMTMRLVPSLALSAFVWVFTAGSVQSQESVLTYHNHSNRNGWNPKETVLTPSSVPSSFGYITTVPVHDQVDTQPLVVPNVSIQGKVHSVVYVTTEGNNVYAIDAASGEILLPIKNLGKPVPVDSVNWCNNNGSNVGINGTGTIDPNSHTLYVIAFSVDAAGRRYDLHALSLETLEEQPGFPVSISHTFTVTLQDNSPTSFNANVEHQRPALLDANGKIYAGFGSFCDNSTAPGDPNKTDRSRGWLLSVDKNSSPPAVKYVVTNQWGPKSPLVKTETTCWSYFNQSIEFPCFLSSVWMSGYGLASDSKGNIYFTTGNTSPGTFDSKYNIAESAVQLSKDLTLVSLFTPSPPQEKSLDLRDQDFGSGGLMVLPPQTNAAVAAGKDGNLWLLNLGDMTPVVTHPPNPNPISIGACWCGPSYFETSNGAIVVTSGGNGLQTWSVGTSPSNVLSLGSNPLASASSPVEEGYHPGFFTSVSSNGTKEHTAIIWAVGGAVADSPTSPSKMHVTLYAFDAAPSGGQLRLLWHENAGKWSESQAMANIVPTVANGRVYVASDGELEIFGIRPVCTGETDCTGMATFTCAGHNVGLKFNGSCNQNGGCTVGFTGTSPVSANWQGSPGRANSALACVTDAEDGYQNCIKITAPAPPASCNVPGPPIPQCGEGERWCTKFTPPRCAPFVECTIQINQPPPQSPPR